MSIAYAGSTRQISLYVNAFCLSLTHWGSGNEQGSVAAALLQFLLISHLSAMIRSENKSASIPCLAISLDPPGSLAAWLWLVSIAVQGLHITLRDGVEHISGLVDHARLQTYEHLAVFANRMPTKKQQGVTPDTKMGY